MNWILFLLYLVLFSWLLTKIGFIKQSGLPKWMICCLFTLKVLAGIAYFQFYSLPANKPTSDTWKFYNRSIEETDKLLHDPALFTKSLFTSKYKTTGGLFSDQQSYWNDVKDDIMVKMMAVFNIFTNKHYYSNIIFFNFLFFFGLIAFYRLMRSFFPEKNYLLLASVFLIPSFLFWCSGIHKDGLIFSLLGMIFFCFHQLLQRKNLVRNLLFIILSFAFIFLLRSYIVLALFPCLIIGMLMHLFPNRRYLVATLSLTIGAILIFTLKYIHPKLDIPAYIVEKQSQFKQLQGGSAINTPDLQPGIQSFIATLPSALDVAFVRPHINENGISSKIAAIEILFVWMILFYCLIRCRKISIPPIIITCWIFSFIVLIIIGYTVNFSGAVVRYRSLVLPFLLAPAVGFWLSQKQIIKKIM